VAKRAQQTERLSTTTWSILGMLTVAEMSGYDLLKAVEGSIGYFFSPAKSHVYTELRKLVSMGYATERYVRQKDRPDKRLYKINPTGMKALRGWLAREDEEPESMSSEIILKLFFGKEMDQEALLAKLKRNREECVSSLQEFKELEKFIADKDEVFFPYMTLRCGIAHTRASIRWMDETIKLIEERSAR
jgi:PadR family transcriptional regulator, regulatory protein AphA